MHSIMHLLPYSAKRWRRKRLANPTEDYIAKKILVIASLKNNKTLLAKSVGNYQYVCDV